MIRKRRAIALAVLLAVASSPAIVVAQESATIAVAGNVYDITVAPEYAGDEYDRDNWDVWDRVDRTGFNVRCQVLSDESFIPVVINTESSYWRTRVLSGRWIFPYTGSGSSPTPTRRTSATTRTTGSG
tara:strand:+ start:1769 stop:2152 length:384 start_codon:yes stop_codon:yes gene_type:complete